MRFPFVVLGLALASGALAATPHPLDPLDASEITKATELTRRHKGFPKGALFPLIALEEPPKAAVLAAKPDEPLPRVAQVVVLDRKKNRTFEARVDLGQGRVLSWQPLPGVQPLVLVEEYETVPRIVKADARWQAAMKKRGIDDFSKVWVDTWATGTFAPKGQEGARLLRGVSYLQDGAVNFYGRPIEGVIAVVNMNTETVVDLIDTGVVPISPERVEFDEASLGKRAQLPLEIAQPKGPGFTTEGRLVRWQNWAFRWAMHPREGLVLYDVRYEDAAGSRPILYRGALSEMVVPYGDPDENWIWRNAFDEGEYGVGRLAAPLEPNQDAPANAVFFDADFADDFGKAYVLKNAVGLYERDAGILWKHYDIYKNKNETRRARELVIFFIATIGNYDYAVNWILRQDGAIQVQCDLTGIMLAKGVAAARAEHHLAHSHLVAPNVAAPHHQHFFNFRLDLDVEGPKNTAFEMDTRAAPPTGMEMTETALKRESTAKRDMSMASARKWRIGSTGKPSALGYPPSFLLVPGSNAVPYLAPDTPTRRRAPFVDHHVFVTRYKDDERHAGGWYPNQSPGGTGLDAYTADDEAIENEDVVLWYTMGITHVPRPEEWPIMPVHKLGFELLPAGFFDRNPGLDVPR